MIRIETPENLEQIYACQRHFATPWFFPASYEAWENSFLRDVDRAGRPLFSSLVVKAAYEDDRLLGFIQYGNTAFGFDEGGEISSRVSYCVIRNLYFAEGRDDAGTLLLRQALEAFPAGERVYAFFHYFGMSCFARHGKLFARHGHIEKLLQQHRFEIEHENVYYSSPVTAGDAAAVTVIPQEMTKGNQQYMDFSMSGQPVGGCEIHYPEEKTAYLRWIYINGDLTGRGIGTKCMGALKQWLLEKGIRRLDTDTALSNTVAQHFYEKNGFTREGISRSYLR